MFSLKERDDREQKVQQFLDQLRVALIEFALFDAIDELLNLGRISGEDIIVVFHRIRSRRSYAEQKRTPRPERKYFLLSRGLTAGTLAKCQACGENGRSNSTWLTNSMTQLLEYDLVQDILRKHGYVDNCR